MRREGFILMTVLSMAFLIVVLLAVSSTFAVSSRQAVASEAQKIPTFYVANSGLERVYAKIANDIAVNEASYVNLTPSGISSAVFNSVFGSVTTPTPVAGSVYADTTKIGTFNVVATTPVGQVTTLTSTGLAGGSTRKITLTYRIDAGRITANALAAVEATSTVIDTGNALISGQLGAPVTAKEFAFTCPLSAPTQNCAKTTTSGPAVYNINIAPGSANIPVLGQQVTYSLPSSDSKTSVRYTVSAVSINPDGSASVTLTAITELAVSYSGSTQTLTDTPLTSQYKLAPTTEAASMYSYAAAPITQTPNASVSCTKYDCNTMSVPPGSLFESVFGVKSDVFYADLKDTASKTTADANASNADKSCTPVRYVKYSASSTFQIDKNCGTQPRVLIVDTGTSTNTLSFSNDNFTGILFVISQANVQFPNNGYIKGALFVDNGGTTGSQFKITGNANNGSFCADGAKICYDATTVSTLLGGLRSSMSTTANPILSLSNNWNEAK